MHDLVRDVAHLIAKNENKGIKCEVENDVTLEQNSVRYLWCKKLPNDLDYSNLEFLYVATEVEVLDEIFTRMGKLRVLILENQRWNTLSLSTMSFKSLTNLRCLILWGFGGWKLNDISFIRYMKKLESLSLKDCSLPSFIDLQKDDAVSHLTKLKLLVLHKCEMERNIFEVIGRIPQLEELHIVDCTTEFHKTFSVPQTLQRYTIISDPFLNKDPWFVFSPNERTLVLKCFDISNEATKRLAKKAKNLYVKNIEGGAKNIIPDIFQLEGGGMPELNKLHIDDATEIECLVDSSNNHTSEVVGSLFSSLNTLLLSHCPHLTSLLKQAITPNPVRYTIFQNLQEVDIYRCGELKYVFSANTVGGLPQLRRLRIKDCHQLEQIVEGIIPSVANQLEIIEENTSTTSAPLVNHSPDEAAELEELIGFEQGAFNNFQFQHLKTLEITGSAKLEVIFPLSVVRCLPELECLVISECKELKHIMEEDESDRIQRELKPWFPKLTVVIVDQCHKLKHLFSMYGADEQRKGEEIGKAKVELPKLKLLVLTHLSNLCQGIELGAPKHSIIINCPKLSLTSTTTIEELYENFPVSEFAKLEVPAWKLEKWIYDIKKSNEVSKSGSTSEFPSTQVKTSQCTQVNLL